MLQRSVFIIFSNKCSLQCNHLWPHGVMGNSLSFISAKWRHLATPTKECGAAEASLSLSSHEEYLIVCGATIRPLRLVLDVRDRGIHGRTNQVSHSSNSFGCFSRGGVSFKIQNDKDVWQSKDLKVDSCEYDSLGGSGFAL